MGKTAEEVKGRGTSDWVEVGNVSQILKDKNIPIPSRAYPINRIEADVASQIAVRLEDSVYFIDQGRVFEVDAKSQTARYLEESFQVKALSLYQDTLLALQGDGDVFLWNATNRRWASIGARGASIVIAGTHIVGLNTDGELWAFQGKPGKITFGYYPKIYAAFLNGERIRFSDTGLRGVTRIESLPNDALIHFKAGGSMRYTELPAP